MNRPNIIKIKPNLLALKAISLLVLIAFSVNSTLAYAQGVEVNFAPPLKITIPEELGTITTVIPKGPSAVIHIQDAHAELGAQENIQKILRHLKKSHGLNTVYLEGGLKGRISADLLRFTSNEEQNKKINQKLLSKGLIGGPELLLLSKEYQGYGTESLTLYKRNLSQYRRVLSKKDKSEQWIESERLALSKKASQVLSYDLYKFTREYLLFQDNKQELLGHLNTLLQFSKKHLNKDLQDPIHQIEYPQLVRLFKLRELEKQHGDFAEEKERLFQWIKKNGLDSFISEFQSTSDTRTFLESFYAQAKDKHFSFKDYPNLSKELGRRILAEELDALSLFHEIDALTDELLLVLVQTKEERNIIQSFRTLHLLNKLAHLELARDELKQIKSLHVPELFRPALRFYRTAELRERQIFQSLLKTMKKNKQGRVVLVTGGFHEEGLKSLISERNLTYVSISPKIHSLDQDKTYEKVMTLQPTSTVTPVSFGRINIRLFNPKVSAYYSKELEHVLEAAKARSELREETQEVTDDLEKSEPPQVVEIPEVVEKSFTSLYSVIRSYFRLGTLVQVPLVFVVWILTIRPIDMYFHGIGHWIMYKLFLSDIFAANHIELPYGERLQEFLDNPSLSSFFNLRNYTDRLVTEYVHEGVPSQFYLVLSYAGGHLADLCTVIFLISMIKILHKANRVQYHFGIRFMELLAAWTMLTNFRRMVLNTQNDLTWPSDFYFIYQKSGISADWTLPFIVLVPLLYVLWVPTLLQSPIKKVMTGAALISGAFFLAYPFYLVVYPLWIKLTMTGISVGIASLGLYLFKTFRAKVEVNKFRKSRSVFSFVLTNLAIFLNTIAAGYAFSDKDLFINTIDSRLQDPAVVTETSLKENILTPEWASQVNGLIATRQFDKAKDKFFQFYTRRSQFYPPASDILEYLFWETNDESKHTKIKEFLQGLSFEDFIQLEFHRKSHAVTLRYGSDLIAMEASLRNIFSERGAQNVVHYLSRNFLNLSTSDRRNIFRKLIEIEKINGMTDNFYFFRFDLIEILNEQILKSEALEEEKAAASRSDSRSELRTDSANTAAEFFKEHLPNVIFFDFGQVIATQIEDYFDQTAEKLIEYSGISIDKKSVQYGALMGDLYSLLIPGRERAQLGLPSRNQIFSQPALFNKWISIINDFLIRNGAERHVTREEFEEAYYGPRTLNPALAEEIGRLFVVKHALGIKFGIISNFESAGKKWMLDLIDRQLPGLFDRELVVTSGDARAVKSDSTKIFNLALTKFEKMTGQKARDAVFIDNFDWNSPNAQKSGIPYFIHYAFAGGEAPFKNDQLFSATLHESTNGNFPYLESLYNFALNEPRSELRNKKAFSPLLLAFGAAALYGLTTVLAKPVLDPQTGNVSPLTYMVTLWSAAILKLFYVDEKMLGIGEKRSVSTQEVAPARTGVAHLITKHIPLVSDFKLFAKFIKAEKKSKEDLSALRWDRRIFESLKPSTLVIFASLFSQTLGAGTLYLALAMGLNPIVYALIAPLGIVILPGVLANLWLGESFGKRELIGYGLILATMISIPVIQLSGLATQVNYSAAFFGVLSAVFYGLRQIFHQQLKRKDLSFLSESEKTQLPMWLNRFGYAVGFITMASIALSAGIPLFIAGFSMLILTLINMLVWTTMWNFIFMVTMSKFKSSSLTAALATAFPFWTMFWQALLLREFDAKLFLIGLGNLAGGMIASYKHESNTRSELRSVVIDQPVPVKSNNIVLNSKQNWLQAFKHPERPLVVEVGPGSSEALLARAANEPDKNFIGIDLSADYVELLAQKIRNQKLTNIRLVYAADSEAFLDQWVLGNHEIISELYYFHPMPGATYAFSRYVYMRCLARLLRPEATVHFVVATKFLESIRAAFLERKFTLTKESPSTGRSSEVVLDFSWPENSAKEIRREPFKFSDADNKTGREIKKMVHTTKLYRHLETDFRAAHFNLFIDGLYQKALQQGKTRILSAGTSTGEEAFTIAMELLRKGLLPEQIEIVGIDISSEVIQQARSGRIRFRDAVAKSEVPALTRHFIKEAGSLEVEVSPEIRSIVHFDVANLAEANVLMKYGPFDGVMFWLAGYLNDFNQNQQIFENFKKSMADGTLLLTNFNFNDTDLFIRDSNAKNGFLVFEPSRDFPRRTRLHTDTSELLTVTNKSELRSKSLLYEKLTQSAHSQSKWQYLFSIKWASVIVAVMLAGLLSCINPIIFDNSRSPDPNLLSKPPTTSVRPLPLDVVDFLESSESRTIASGLHQIETRHLAVDLEFLRRFLDHEDPPVVEAALKVILSQNIEIPVRYFKPYVRKFKMSDKNLSDLQIADIVSLSADVGYKYDRLMADHLVKLVFRSPYTVEKNISSVSQFRIPLLHFLQDHKDFLSQLQPEKQIQFIYGVANIIRQKRWEVYDKDQVIFGPEQRVIIAAHEDSEFDIGMLKNMLLARFGVRLAEEDTFKGHSDSSSNQVIKELFFSKLDEVSRNKEPATVWAYGHGGDNRFWLARGEAEDIKNNQKKEIKDDDVLPEAISYKELADALLNAQSDRQLVELDHLIVILDACYSADIAEKMFNKALEESADRRHVTIHSFPIVIAVANRGRVGYINKFRDAVELSTDSMFTVRTLIDSTDPGMNAQVPFNQDPAVWISISIEDIEALKKKLGLPVDAYVKPYLEISRAPDTENELQLAMRSELRMAQPKIAPEEAAAARAVDMYKLHRELLILFDGYNRAVKARRPDEADTILGEIKKYASNLDSLIQEVRSEDMKENLELTLLEKKTPDELLEFHREISREYERDYIPQFEKAHLERDIKTLNELNAQAIPLLKEKLKAQLLLVKNRLESPKRYQNQIPLLIYGAIRTYWKISYEHAWRSRRQKAEQKLEMFRVLDASGALNFTLYYEREPALRVRRDAEGAIHLSQYVWKFQDVERGRRALMPVLIPIRFNELDEAYRSRIHAIESQEQDYAQLIYHDLALADIDQVLKRHQKQNNLPLALREQIVSSLELVLRGHKRKGGLAAKKVRLKSGSHWLPMPGPSLEVALSRLDHSDLLTSDTADAVQMIDSARKWIHTRLNQLPQIREGTARKRDYILLLIRDKDILQALEFLTNALKSGRPFKIKEHLERFEALHQTYFRFVIRDLRYESMQRKIQAVIAALRSLNRDHLQTNIDLIRIQINQETRHLTSKPRSELRTFPTRYSVKRANVIENATTLDIFYWANELHELLNTKLSTGENFTFPIMATRGRWIPLYDKKNRQLVFSHITYRDNETTIVEPDYFVFRLDLNSRKLADAIPGARIIYFAHTEAKPIPVDTFMIEPKERYLDAPRLTGILKSGVSAAHSLSHFSKFLLRYEWDIWGVGPENEKRDRKEQAIALQPFIHDGERLPDHIKDLPAVPVSDLAPRMPDLVGYSKNGKWGFVAEFGSTHSASRHAEKNVTGMLLLANGGGGLFGIETLPLRIMFYADSINGSAEHSTSSETMNTESPVEQLYIISKEQQDVIRRETQRIASPSPIRSKKSRKKEKTRLRRFLTKLQWLVNDTVRQFAEKSSQTALPEVIVYFVEDGVFIFDDTIKKPRTMPVRVEFIKDETGHYVINEKRRKGGVEPLKPSSNLQKLLQDAQEKLNRLTRRSELRDSSTVKGQAALFWFNAEGGYPNGAPDIVINDMALREAGFKRNELKPTGRKFKKSLEDAFYSLEKNEQQAMLQTQRDNKGETSGSRFVEFPLPVRVEQGLPEAAIVTPHEIILDAMMLRAPPSILTFVLQHGLRRSLHRFYPDLQPHDSAVFHSSLKYYLSNENLQKDWQEWSAAIQSKNIFGRNWYASIKYAAGILKIHREWKSLTPDRIRFIYQKLEVAKKFDVLAPSVSTLFQENGLSIPTEMWRETFLDRNNQPIADIYLSYDFNHGVRKIVRLTTADTKDWLATEDASDSVVLGDIRLDLVWDTKEIAHEIINQRIILERNPEFISLINKINQGTPKERQIAVAKLKALAELVTEAGRSAADLLFSLSKTHPDRKVRIELNRYEFDRKTGRPHDFPASTFNYSAFSTDGYTVQAKIPFKQGVTRVRVKASRNGEMLPLTNVEPGKIEGSEAVFEWELPVTDGWVHYAVEIWDGTKWSYHNSGDPKLNGLIKFQEDVRNRRVLSLRPEVFNLRLENMRSLYDENGNLRVGTLEDLKKQLKDIKRQGFGEIYLQALEMGARGEAGPDPSVFSPLSHRYINHRIGGMKALLDLKKVADEVGLELSLDMIPHISRSNREIASRTPVWIYDFGSRKLVRRAASDGGFSSEWLDSFGRNWADPQTVRDFIAELSELAKLGFNFRIDVGHVFDITFETDPTTRGLAKILGQAVTANQEWKQFEGDWREFSKTLDLNDTNEPSAVLGWIIYEVKKAGLETGHHTKFYAEQWHGHEARLIQSGVDFPYDPMVANFWQMVRKAAPTNEVIRTLRYLTHIWNQYGGGTATIINNHDAEVPPWDAFGNSIFAALMAGIFASGGVVFQHIHYSFIKKDGSVDWEKALAEVWRVYVNNFGPGSNWPGKIATTEAGLESNQFLKALPEFYKTVLKILHIGKSRPIALHVGHDRVAGIAREIAKDEFLLMFSHLGSPFAADINFHPDDSKQDGQGLGDFEDDALYSLEEIFNNEKPGVSIKQPGERTLFTGREIKRLGLGPRFPIPILGHRAYRFKKEAEQLPNNKTENYRHLLKDSLARYKKYGPRDRFEHSFIAKKIVSILESKNSRSFRIMFEMLANAVKNDTNLNVGHLGDVFHDVVTYKPSLKSQLHQALIDVAIIDRKNHPTASETAAQILRSHEIGEIVLTSPETMWTSGTGGLATYVSDLARELASMGIPVTVISPLFLDQKAKTFERYGLRDTGRTITVKFGQNHQGGFESAVAKIYEANIEGVRVLLLENDKYFHQLKGKPWFGESAYNGSDVFKLRFSRMLSLGTLLAIREMNIHASIIQTNEWSTGYVKAYLEGRERIDSSAMNLRFDDHLAETKVISILHNLGKDYQGRVETHSDDQRNAMVEHDLGFSRELDWDILVTRGETNVINPTFTAIQTSDHARTVSNGYYQRSLDLNYNDEFGGLVPVLIEKNKVGAYDGILNGFGLVKKQREYFEKMMANSEVIERIEFYLGQARSFAKLDYRKWLQSVIRTGRPDRWVRSFLELGHEKFRRMFADLHYDFIKPFQKEKLQQAVGLETGSSKIVYSSLARVSDQKGFQLLLAEVWNSHDPRQLQTLAGQWFEEMGILQGLTDSDFQKLIDYAHANNRQTLRAVEVAMILFPELQIIIAGSAESDYFRNGFHDVANKFQKQFRYIDQFISPDNRLHELINSGSDIFGMPSRYEPGGISNQEAAAYGTRRHLTRRDGLRDHEVKIDGFAEGFEPFNPVSWFISLKAHYEFAKDPNNADKLREIHYRLITQDNRWLKHARKYVEKYHELNGSSSPKDLVTLEAAGAINRAEKKGHANPADELMAVGFTAEQAIDAILAGLRFSKNKRLIKALTNIKKTDKQFLNEKDGLIEYFSQIGPEVKQLLINKINEAKRVPKTPPHVHKRFNDALALASRSELRFFGVPERDASWWHDPSKTNLSVSVPISSLRREGQDFGIGKLTNLGIYFKEILKKQGISTVLLLPHYETIDESPYAPVSSHAINELYVDWSVVEEAADDMKTFPKLVLKERQAVQYDSVRKREKATAAQAFKTFAVNHLGKGTARDQNYQEFVNKNRWWLDDYVEFMALYAILGKLPRNPKSLEAQWLESDIREARANPQYKILTERHRYVQWLAYGQLREAVDLIHQEGGHILFDAPMFRSKDSMAVWKFPRYFRDIETGYPGVEIKGYVHEHWRDLALWNWKELKQENYRAVLDPIRYWLDFGFDGARMDALHFAYDFEGKIGRGDEPGDDFLRAATDIFKEFNALPIAEAFNGAHDAAANFGFLPVHWDWRQVSGHDDPRLYSTLREFTEKIKEFAYGQNYFSGKYAKFISFALGDQWGDGERIKKMSADSSRSFWHYRIPLASDPDYKIRARFDAGPFLANLTSKRSELRSDKQRVEFLIGEKLGEEVRYALHKKDYDYANDLIEKFISQTIHIVDDSNDSYDYVIGFVKSYGAVAHHFSHLLKVDELKPDLQLTALKFHTQLFQYLKSFPEEYFEQEEVQDLIIGITQFSDVLRHLKLDREVVELLNFFREKVKSGPNRFVDYNLSRAHLNLAIEYWDQGREADSIEEHLQAIEHFSRGINVFEWDEPVQTSLGPISTASLIKAIDLTNSENSQAQDRSEWLLFNLAEAIRIKSKTSEFPEDSTHLVAFILHRIARHWINQHGYSLAEPYVELAYKLDPEEIHVLHNKVSVAAESGDLHNAKQYLTKMKKAREHAPGAKEDNRQGLIDRAELQIKIAGIKKARRNLEVDESKSILTKIERANEKYGTKTVVDEPQVKEVSESDKVFKVLKAEILKLFKKVQDGKLAGDSDEFLNLQSVIQDKITDAQENGLSENQGGMLFELLYSVPEDVEIPADFETEASAETKPSDDQPSGVSIPDNPVEMMKEISLAIEMADVNRVRQVYEAFKVYVQKKLQRGKLNRAEEDTQKAAEKFLSAKRSELRAPKTITQEERKQTFVSAIQAINARGDAVNIETIARETGYTVGTLKRSLGLLHEAGMPKVQSELFGRLSRFKALIQSLQNGQKEQLVTFIISLRDDLEISRSQAYALIHFLHYAGTKKDSNQAVQKALGFSDLEQVSRLLHGRQTVYIKKRGALFLINDQPEIRKFLKDRKPLDDKTLVRLGRLLLSRSGNLPVLIGKLKEDERSNKVTQKELNIEERIRVVLAVLRGKTHHQIAQEFPQILGDLRYQESSASTIGNFLTQDENQKKLPGALPELLEALSKQGIIENNKINAEALSAWHGSSDAVYRAAARRIENLSSDADPAEIISVLQIFDKKRLPLSRLVKNFGDYAKEKNYPFDLDVAFFVATHDKQNLDLPELADEVARYFSNYVAQITDRPINFMDALLYVLRPSNNYFFTTEEAAQFFANVFFAIERPDHQRLWGNTLAQFTIGEFKPEASTIGWSRKLYNQFIRLAFPRIRILPADEIRSLERSQKRAAMIIDEAKRYDFGYLMDQKAELNRRYLQADQLVHEFLAKSPLIPAVKFVGLNEDDLGEAGEALWSAAWDFDPEIARQKSPPTTFYTYAIGALNFLALRLKKKMGIQRSRFTQFSIDEESGRAVELDVTAAPGGTPFQHLSSDEAKKRIEQALAALDANFTDRERMIFKLVHGLDPEFQFTLDYIQTAEVLISRKMTGTESGDITLQRVEQIYKDVLNKLIRILNSTSPDVIEDWRTMIKQPKRIAELPGPITAEGKNGTIPLFDNIQLTNYKTLGRSKGATLDGKLVVVRALRSVIGEGQKPDHRLIVEVSYFGRLLGYSVLTFSALGILEKEERAQTWEEAVSYIKPVSSGPRSELRHDQNFINAVSKQFPGLQIPAPISLSKPEVARTAEVLAGEFPKEGIVLIQQHPEDENNLGYIQFSDILLNEIAKSLVTHFGFRFVYVDFENFSVAVREAVKNAIVWGNEYQSGKIFGIHWKLDEDWTFYVDVLDEGKSEFSLKSGERKQLEAEIPKTMARAGLGRFWVNRFLKNQFALRNSDNQQIGNVARLALTYRSELRLSQTGSSTNLRREAAVVAGDVSELVLRRDDAIALGASRLLQFLREWNPSAYAEEVKRENYASLLADQNLAANAINQLIIVMKEVPVKNDPYMQVLSDILEQSKLSKARIIVPGAVREKILEARKTFTKRGVDLTISDRDENVAGLIQSYSGRTLVYDYRPDELQVIENKRDTLNQPGDILLVQDDATIENRALALLNAVEFLNQKKDLRSFGVASAMGLLQLTENLNIRNRAELRLEQAA